MTPNDIYRLVGLIGALEAVAESIRPKLDEMLKNGGLPFAVRDSLKELTTHEDLQHIHTLALGVLMDDSLAATRAKATGEGASEARRRARPSEPSTAV